MNLSMRLVLNRALSGGAYGIEEDTSRERQTGPDCGRGTALPGTAGADLRAQALKLYPWICARCGREFSGKKLRELTVHHKDHNHDYNPPDGSNWELLCLYCHENEHARQQVADAYGEATPGEEREPPATYRPFAEIEELLQRKT